MRNYILPDEKDFYFQKLVEIEKEIEQVGIELGDSTSDSETTHDNPEFDYAMEKQKQLMIRKSKILKILNSVVLGLEDILRKGFDEVTIGSEVCVRYIDGKELNLIIGGHCTPFVQDNRISYDSPFAKLLIGKKSGDKIDSVINGNKINFEILKVNKINFDNKFLNQKDRCFSDS